MPEVQHAQHECEALADRLVRASVPCAPIYDVLAALADPHIAHRGMVVEIGEGYRGVASPIKSSGTLATYRVAPAKRRLRRQDVCFALIQQ